MNEGRKFGLVVGGVFTLLGVALLLAGSRLTGVAFGSAGLVLVLLGAAAPARLGPLHRGWMAVARVLGLVNTTLFLGLVFFLVLTPLGFAFRLTGRDELAPPPPAPDRVGPLPGAQPRPAPLREDVLMAKHEVLAELWEFLKYHKKYWLAPIVIVLVLVGLLLVLAEKSVLAPFIYTLF